MKSFRFLFAASLIATALVGCGSGDSADPNYKQEVTLSEAGKAKEAANMAGQSAPGVASGAPAAALPPPPGKGGR